MRIECNIKLFSAIHKHYSLGEWNHFMSKAPKGIENYIALSCGTGSHDSEKITQLLHASLNYKL